MFSLAAYEYHQNKNFMKITRRVLRDTLDPFDMPDERFREMYRLPRSLALDFLYILDDVMGCDNLCTQIPLSVQFCSVLNFYASGSYQRRVASDAFAMMSQTCVSRCITSISRVIATKLMDSFIQFPQNLEEIQRLEQEFQRTYDFPGVFAIVDGSQVALAALGRLIEFAFLNRKGFHSINTQIVIDSQMLILSINARFPGSTHDSHVWGSSLVYQFLREIAYLSNQIDGSFEYFMLADNGYPLQPWLLKPYDRPCRSRAEEIFNRHHKQLRSLIERTIGILKARFRCLLRERKLRYGHETAGHIIYSCAVLHNFLIRNGYPVKDIEPIFEDGVENFEEIWENDGSELEEGKLVRDAVAQYFIDRNY